MVDIETCSDKEDPVNAQRGGRLDIPTETSPDSPDIAKPLKPTARTKKEMATPLL